MADRLARPRDPGRYLANPAFLSVLLGVLMSDSDKPLWYRRLPEFEQVTIDVLRQAGFYVDDHFTCGTGTLTCGTGTQIRVSVLWCNPAEHFHVTQLAIRGDVPATVLSHLVAFSKLQKLSVYGVSPEIVVQMNKRLPKCQIVNISV